MARRAIAIVVASSLLGLSLTGCGAPASPLAGTGIGTASGVQAQAYTSAQLALKFARQIEAQTGKMPEVRGTQVILRTAEGEDAIYDFSHTPSSGKVVFRAGDLQTEFKWSPEDQVNTKAIPAIVVAVAVKMVWGGTKAFLKYWLTHRGDEFDKKDCVKAVVFGMVAEGLYAVPVVGGVLGGYLWPIAWKWVDKWIDGNWPWDAKRFFEMGMDMKDEVAKALHEAINQTSDQSQPQSQPQSQTQSR